MIIKSSISARAMRLLLWLTILCLMHGAPAAATEEQNYGSAVVEEVTSIYDGDTFRVNLQGYPAIIGNSIAIRVANIDTPELRSKNPDEKALAQQAKQYTVQRLREARRIELQNMRRGKYFRILADVIVDGSSLGDELISRGMAVRYDGGKKVSWETIIIKREGEAMEIRKP